MVTICHIDFANVQGLPVSATSLLHLFYIYRESTVFHTQGDSYKSMPKIPLTQNRQPYINFLSQIFCRLSERLYLCKNLGNKGINTTTMKINNLSERDSIINRYLAEMRDCEYQKNRLLFRNNIKRIGEYEAFEISKTLDYETKDVTTPLGVAKVNLPTDKIVIGTIFRAGLPFHEGFLNVFDHSGNAFVSAYREYTNESHTEVGVHIEYLATPEIDGKTLIIADPMLATGISMEMGLKAILTKGNPKHIHVACVLAAPEGIEHIQKTFPDDKTTIWCASIDEGLNEHKYIVPGFGDAGDLCYGNKL